MMKQLPVFPHPVTHALMWGDLGKGKGEVKAAKLLVDGGWNGVWGGIAVAAGIYQTKEESSSAREAREGGMLTQHCRV